MNNTDNRSVSGEEIYLEIHIQSSFLCDTICQLLSFPLPLLMSQSSLFIVQKKKGILHNCNSKKALWKAII